MSHHELWTVICGINLSLIWMVNLEYGNLVSFFTGAFFQEAIGGLFPAAMALGAPVGRPVALPRPLHGAVGARGRAWAPGRPLVPGSVH